jgi:hypothetical protein
MSDDELKCAICQDNLVGNKPCVYINCRCTNPANLYHEECIVRWLRQSKRERQHLVPTWCPTCRSANCVNARRTGTATALCPNCRSPVRGGSAMIQIYQRRYGGRIIDLATDPLNSVEFVDLTEPEVIDLTTDTE